MEEMSNVYQLLVRKSDGMRPFGKIILIDFMV
jgi:hypothetical protein